MIIAAVAVNLNSPPDLTVSLYALVGTAILDEKMRLEKRGESREESNGDERC